MIIVLNVNFCNTIVIEMKETPEELPPQGAVPLRGLLSSLLFIHSFIYHIDAIQNIDGRHDGHGEVGEKHLIVLDRF